MSTKEQLTVIAKEKFLQFGSKHITMDELATLLGMSKKTIYKHFTSKEELVVASINLLIDEFNADIIPIIENEQTAIAKITDIYKIIFTYISQFKPSFIFGLQKYYPKAYKTYKDFTFQFVATTVKELLKEAQLKAEIRNDVDIELFMQVHLQDLENRLFEANNMFDKYSKEELLEYMIVNSLKSIKK